MASEMLSSKVCRMISNWSINFFCFCWIERRYSRWFVLFNN